LAKISIGLDGSSRIFLQANWHRDHIDFREIQ